MSISRRRWIGSAAAMGGAVMAGKASALAGQELAVAEAPAASPGDGTMEKVDFVAHEVKAVGDVNGVKAMSPGEPGKDYTPVGVPNGWTLPFKIVDGVKVFHLVAGEVYHEFAPGLRARCWGYNQSVHGPVIEVVEGDRVRIFVTNQLPAATTVHWHGILLASGMDGVGGLSQKPILPGETFMYEFTLRQHGTYMYHSHHDEMTQMGMGLTGMLVIHPRWAKGDRADRDFVLMLHEWRVDVGTDRPNPNEMTDFNLLTLNAKVFPGTWPLIIKQGDKVRIRFGNLSAMDHHPIHMHGYAFRITEIDGGKVPLGAQGEVGTVLVPVGSTRVIEFVANNPGDWAMHCHMTHHVMNQMGHELPNVVGMDVQGLDEKVRAVLPDYMTMGQAGMEDMESMHMEVPENSLPMVGGGGPAGYITMGGMFTILKVREKLKSYEVDPGWYENKAGEMAMLATAGALNANGVTADGGGAAVPPWKVLKKP